jgi:GNAT superfamily N-acetyltransferase
MPEVVVPLTVRNLTAEDLHPGFAGWSETHRQGTLEALERAKLGDVDFLAVCPPSGIPVATGGVDYAKPSGIPVIWQLEVDARLHSCGIGTLLIEALEQRIRDRGLTWAELGVDENHPRPRALYERLGYVVTGREPGAWNQEAPDGTVTRYETTITVLRKNLTQPTA